MFLPFSAEPRLGGTQPSPASLALAAAGKQRAMAAAKPLEIVDLPCIRGGPLTSPVALPLVPIASPSGEVVQFVPISKDEKWLILAITGAIKTKRTLKRCKIFQIIRDGLHVAEGQGRGELGAAEADPMDSMAFDDEEASESPTKKAKLKSHRRMDGKVKRVAKGQQIISIEVPAQASSVEEKRVVRAMEYRNKLMLERDALPWLLKYIRAEMESGSVPPVEDGDFSSGSQPDCSIYWDFRDDCWIAEARGRDSECKKRRGPVTSRLANKEDECFGMSRAKAKKHVYGELVAWLKEEGCTLSAESDPAPADVGALA